MVFTDVYRIQHTQSAELSQRDSSLAVSGDPQAAQLLQPSKPPFPSKCRLFACVIVSKKREVRVYNCDIMEQGSVAAAQMFTFEVVFCSYFVLVFEKGRWNHRCVVPGGPCTHF